MNLIGGPFISQSFLCISLLLYPGKLTYIQRKGLLFLMIGLAIYVIFSDTSLIASRFREISFIGAFPALFSRFETVTLHVYAAYFFFLVICIFHIYLLIEMFVHQDFLEAYMLFRPLY